MVDHLDRCEIEAVLSHELEHVARHDYLVIWLATVLRDAFFYLPTSWTAYRQFQHEKELACDDVVVQATRRPLALASALTKVWLHAVEGSRFAPLATPLHLAGENKRMNDRIERLLAPRERMANSARLRIDTVTVSVSALVVLLSLEAVNVTLNLLPMGCSPALLLGKLF
jgi:beta-lactamase regulating signal transducer with metallopeptidase domain